MERIKKQNIPFIVVSGAVKNDTSYRALGLGKILLNTIVNHEQLKGCLGILGTRDAHGLYEKYGFNIDNDRFMRKSAE